MLLDRAVDGSVEEAELERTLDRVRARLGERLDHADADFVDTNPATPVAADDGDGDGENLVLPSGQRRERRPTARLEQSAFVAKDDFSDTDDDGDLSDDTDASLADAVDNEKTPDSDYKPTQDSGVITSQASSIQDNSMPATASHRAAAAAAVSHHGDGAASQVATSVGAWLEGAF